MSKDILPEDVFQETVVENFRVIIACLVKMMGGGVVISEAELQEILNYEITTTHQENPTQIVIKVTEKK
jgi:hypothetical protein